MTIRKRVRLTDAGIARLKPGRTEYIVWDKRMPGLGVRVRPSGHRSFVWHGQATGRAVRATVGSAALMTVESARTACLALQSSKALPGTDDGRGSTGAPLFRVFATGHWLPAAGARWGSSRQREVERMVENQFLPAFGTLRLDRLRRLDVERWFDAYSKSAPGGANNALQVLRQILNAAVGAGLIAANPTAGIRRNPRPKLRRFLSTDEIDRLHRALDRLVARRPSRRQQADIIRLLLMTGCRKSEILTLKRSEVDGNVLRLADSKTGPRTVWLSEAAEAVIARQPRTTSAFVFPSPRHPGRPQSPHLGLWPRARREAGIEDVRLHDLRHTVASQAVARGVPLPTVARMLGHSHPAMTLRYAHVGDREIERAAERVGASIAAAMEENQTSAPP